MEPELQCQICQRIFLNKLTKRRHMENIHSIKEEQERPRNNHFKCPLCEAEEKPISYDDLTKHLKTKHEVNVEETNLTFANLAEFNTWRNNDKRHNYALESRRVRKSGIVDLYYHCNRSNLRSNIEAGHNKCKERAEKTGGSIKIKGVCPSRIFAKILENGTVSVFYVKTHVGHSENELRCEKLTNAEETDLAKKMLAGISKNRILQDTRDIKNGELKRINIVKKKDLQNISRKYNVEKKRDLNDMTATAIKVQEWNSNGRNYAFLFKQVGEGHALLRHEDFALAYMNNTMEKKLKDFSNIICMDGTHGTNKRNWELTIILVKDDTDAGFPIAFLLSNRQDQIIQEVFLGALRDKLGQQIQAKFFMSDDDPKYYNAWTKVMQHQPMKLLCTWHVKKNWNIQGSRKIQNKELRKIMKKDMNTMINETDKNKFEKLKIECFRKLEEEGEVEYLHYLSQYYFQTEGRVSMWAHCHRVKAGINTNMALESFNNVLKTRLDRRANITVEKLLDTLEELVDEKMWRRIINIERPDANNYQDRIVKRAHKEAEKFFLETCNDNSIVNLDLGKYKVKSFKADHYYNVNYLNNFLCECRTMFCSQCKICLHWYECECQQYAVKSTICKHIHLVRMYEVRRSEFVSAIPESPPDSTAQSDTKIKLAEEVTDFVDQKANANEETELIGAEEMKKIVMKEVEILCESLDGDSLGRVAKQIHKIYNEEINYSGNAESRKRKMDKQTYFGPTKKSSNEK